MASKKGLGSFLTFDFGNPSIEINPPKIIKKNLGKYGKIFPFNKYPHRNIYLKGEWHLWIYCTNWNIFVEGTQIAFENSSDDKIENAALFLQGQKLIEVEIVARPAKTIFHFDLNTTVECYNKSYKLGTEIWMLYDPSSNVLVYRNDGKFCYSTSGNTDKWFDIESDKIEIRTSPNIS